MGRETGNEHLRDKKAEPLLPSTEIPSDGEWHHSCQGAGHAPSHDTLQSGRCRRFLLQEESACYAPNTSPETAVVKEMKQALTLASRRKSQGRKVARTKCRGHKGKSTHEKNLLAHIPIS